MVVSVYGKEKCGLCDAAKSKLNLLGVRFASYEIVDFLKLHDGWREDDTVEVTAVYNDIDTLPVICVDRKAYSYPEAMKLLKALVKPPKAAAEPIPMFEFAQASVGDLVAVG